MIDNYYLGIDAGSTMCKAVLMKEHKIIDTALQKSGWNISSTAEEITNHLKEKHSINSQRIKITSTGYGRERIPFADNMLTEISAHAFGGIYLAPQVNGIIDIGGQDSKIIKIMNQKAAAFQMNDKCAAGTGRFLEMACDKLEIALSEIDSFIQTDEYVTINSMCAVFAESEIIGQLASGCQRELILNGCIRSIAARIGVMLSKITPAAGDTFLMTGGLSRSSIIVNAMMQISGYPIITNELSVYAGAIGAALKGAQ